jgi:hypothetical protein
VLNTEAVLAIGVLVALVVMFGLPATWLTAIWWKRSEAAVRRRLIIGVMLAGLIALWLHSRAQAQYIDCNQWPCWVFPCWCWALDRDPMPMPKPLAVPCPEPWMWEAL